MMSEYMRRSTGERSAAAQARAIGNGVVPWPNIPPGYDRGEGKRLVPNGDAGTVLEAFRMRADGATIDAVRTFLAEHGINRSYHGVGSMLDSRLYLGEIHFAAYEPNLTAHPAIVERRVADAACRRSPRHARRRRARPQIGRA